MNWKQKAAESIVKHEAPASAIPAYQNDVEVARLLADRLPNFSARDAEFAASMLAGFRKYGSFTDRQRPHAARLAGIAPFADAPAAPAAVNVADKQLAERLSDYLPRVAARDVDFARSLLAGFARYGSFTAKQRPHVERLVAQFHTDGDAPAAPAAKLYPNLCKVVSLDAFARFVVGNFRASLKNDGSVIWLKWEDKIFGVIEHATGAYRAVRKNHSAATHSRAEFALDQIEQDPRAAASADGILTGRCSCCSRPLTDPQSIEIGIGPICLAKAGW